MSFYTILTDTIHVYTGLSPAALFTIVSLMVVVYTFVSGMFVSPEEEEKNRSLAAEAAVASAFVPPQEPVQIGDMTLEELRAYDGSDLKKPLLMAIKGQVYDVSKSRMFYGPGGHYSLFAGREASRALALLSFDPNDLTSNLEGLSTDALEVLQDWEYKFIEKYVKVGQIVNEKSVMNDDKEEGTGEHQDQNDRMDKPNKEL